MAEPAIQRIKLSELLHDPRNARVRGPKAQAALKESLERYGAGRGIVIDGDGVVRAGNGTLEAAIAAGIEEVLVVETDGKALVAVKRPDWSERDAISYAIADNRTGELAAWDESTLAALLGELSVNGAEGSLPPGYDLTELQTILDKHAFSERTDTTEGFGAVPSTSETQPVSPTRFLVIVDCASEQQQAEVLKDLGEVGLSCRPG